MTINEKALKLHEEWQGKLETVSKTPVRTREDLSLAYTPGVAEPCKVIAENKEAAYTYTWKSNTVAVVSDGSAVLGLGNIGPHAAMPVMEGKAVLFKEFGGVNAVPICLDTQDTEEIIKAVTYLAPGFGGINLEDISAPRCFEIEERLKKILNIPVFHDDQHGTAIVVLAGIINGLKVVDKKKENCKVVVNGAGSAGVAITKLLLKYGFPNVTMCDKVGIIGKDTEAQIVASTIARQIEGKIAYRRAVKMAIASTMRSGAEGIKVQVSGRLNGAEMARSEMFKEGRTPLHTLRADIDYALVEAHTKVGVIGVKVWICRGEVYGKRELAPSFTNNSKESRMGGGHGRNGGRGLNRKPRNNR